MIFELLPRFVSLAPIPMIGTIAFLNAQTVGQLVTSALAPDARLLSTSDSSAQRPRDGAIDAYRPSAADLRRHNPFDHDHVSLAPVTAQSDDEPSSDPSRAPPCEGIYVLVIAASDDQSESLAAFSTATGETLLQRPGGDVHGNIVRFIGRDRVWLSHGATLCQSSLFRETRRGNPPPQRQSARGATPTATGRAGRASAGVEGIARVGATEFEIDRSLRDKLLESQGELMSLASVAPVQEHGKVVGVRLLKVKPESILRSLGLESGDVLHGINGFEVGNTEKILEAYARLRTAETLNLQLTRKGQLTNYDYVIR